MDDIIVKTTATILEKGSITLPLKDLGRYDSDCDSLIKEIGEVLIKDVVVSTKKKYCVTAFLEDDIKPNILFTIVYDKDLNFEYYDKRGGSHILENIVKYVIYAQ